MIRFFAWLAETKAGRAVAGFIALLVALGAGAIEMWRRGARHQADADLAASAQKAIEQANAEAAAARTRQEVEVENAKKPDAPTVAIKDAPAGTPAGDLRRWVRDVSDHDPS